LVFLQIAAPGPKSAACAQKAKLSVNAQAALEAIFLLVNEVFMLVSR
jgi:hypothetical protein